MLGCTHHTQTTPSNAFWFLSARTHTMPWGLGSPSLAPAPSPTPSTEEPGWSWGQPLFHAEIPDFKGQRSFSDAVHALWGAILPYIAVSVPSCRTGALLAKLYKHPGPANSPLPVSAPSLLLSLPTQSLCRSWQLPPHSHTEPKSHLLEKKHELQQVIVLRWRILIFSGIRHNRIILEIFFSSDWL